MSRSLLLPLLLVVLGAAASLCAAGGARAETLTDVQKRITALSKLVESWIALAERDRREDDLARYQAYTEEDFKKKARVKAEDIVALIADKDADKELRLQAVKVLQAAAMTTQDPDLAVDRRDNRKRKQWAKEHLLPLLTRDDDKGGDNLMRAQAAEILNTWFRGMVSARDASDVAAFDASKKKTWDPAAKAWRETLK